MKNLISHIKSGNYANIYLFFGEEAYLKRFYENRLKKKILPSGMEMMNMDTFEGKAAAGEVIGDAIQTLPFMSEYRLVFVKNSGLFVSGRKEETQSVAELVKDIPSSTILVFIEEGVDKRNALYKRVHELGCGVEFKTPKESELVDWIIKLGAKDEIKVSKQVAAYMLKTVSADMDTIAAEAEKLFSYVRDKKTVAAADVDLICAKSLETRIFELVDALGNKQAGRALDIYRNLILMRESPIMVLTMIARQLRLMLQCLELKDAAGVDEISARLGIRSFVARECLKQSGNFTKEDLLGAVNDCFKTDLSIKTGQVSDKIGVEVLIVKYAS